MRPPTPLHPHPCQIHHTHALLLVLGSPVYLTSKMSSTMVSSLMTGVPVIADEAVLKAYTFLTHDDVFLMRHGEDEVDAMLRVSGGTRKGAKSRGVAWFGYKGLLGAHALQRTASSSSGSSGRSSGYCGGCFHRVGRSGDGWVFTA